MTFPKYPKIYYVGSKHTEGFFSPDARDNEIVIEEKMDGANFRFGVIDGQLRVGSRHRDLTSVIRPDGSVDPNIANQFSRAIEYVLQRKDLLHPGYVYFAEYMIPHTLDYDWDHIPLLLGFDVLDTSTGRFLDYDAKIRAFRSANIIPVPLVWRGPLRDFTLSAYQNIPRSRYRNGSAEGLVIKDYSRQFFVKIVAPEFREENKKVFGRGKRSARRLLQDDGSQWFVDAFITRRRIEKVINTLVNEYNYPADMSLLERLIPEVIKDAWSEHWADVAFENVVLDTRRIRKLSAARIVKVYRAWLTRRAILSASQTPNE